MHVNEGLRAAEKIRAEAHQRATIRALHEMRHQERMRDEPLYAFANKAFMLLKVYVGMEAAWALLVWFHGLGH